MTAERLCATCQGVGSVPDDPRNMSNRVSVCPACSERPTCGYCQSAHDAPRDSDCPCTCGSFANRFQLGVEPGCPIHAPSADPSEGGQ